MEDTKHYFVTYQIIPFSAVIMDTILDDSIVSKLPKCFLDDIITMHPVRWLFMKRNEINNAIEDVLNDKCHGRVPTILLMYGMRINLINWCEVEESFVDTYC
jgi:hypothetical protein